MRWQGICYRVFAFPPPNSYVEILTSNVMVFGCGVCGRWWGHKGAALMKAISALTKESPDSQPPYPFPTCEDTARRCCRWPRKRSFTRYQPTSTLILVLPVSRTVGNKCMLSKSPCLRHCDYSSHKELSRYPDVINSVAGKSKKENRKEGVARAGSERHQQVSRWGWGWDPAQSSESDHGSALRGLQKCSLGYCWEWRKEYARKSPNIKDKEFVQ